MKLYGYSNNTKQEPMELNEVTISANSDSLREISQFLLKCAEAIETDKENWEHEHFSINNKSQSESPQLIVFNENIKYE